VPKVCIFVDGENFRHSINDCFTDAEFNSREYLPKKAAWANFFDWLVETVCGEEYQRLRTYWYVLEKVDYFPYKFPNTKSKKGIDSLKITLSKHPEYKEKIKNFGTNHDELKSWMDEEVMALMTKRSNFSNRFHGWQTLQDGISNKHAAIEFRRAGSTTYNLFQSKIGQEKAVDVMLATDLIMLRDIYDVAILVSGDQDYVPAVCCVKDAGKTVINTAFLNQKQRLLPGGARRLNNITDDSYAVKFDDLKRFLLP